MKKYIVKITIILLIILLISNFNSVKVFAEVFGDESDFGSSGKNTDIDKLVDNSVTTAISVARIVGIAIATTMLLAVSIRYMTSSAGDRADIKKHAVVYVVGAMILFGAVGILSVIDSVVKKALPGGE